MTYTHTRITKEYLQKLQKLAEANKRSAMKQLEILIDTAPYPELTFEQEQQLAVILEGYRSNPSNSDKYRYELFAQINDILARPKSKQDSKIG